MVEMVDVVRRLRACFLGAALLGCAVAGRAQQQDLEQQLQQQQQEPEQQPNLKPRPGAPQLVPRPEAAPTDALKRVQLDVQVEDLLGRPVAGLQAGDFSVFDNLAPVKDVTFLSGGAASDPVEIIFMVDALSSDFGDVARVKQQLIGYLKKSGGHLSHPVTIVWLQKSGAKGKGEAQDVIPLLKGSAYLHVIRASTDGVALARRLDASDILVSGSLAAQGVTSGAVQLSLSALEVLATGAAGRPSRKMLIWLSPSWPLLSQPNEKMREQLFDYVVYMYGELRRARVTLYAVDPTGVSSGFNSDGPSLRSANPLLQEMMDATQHGQTMTDAAAGSYSAYLKSPLNVRQTQPNAISLQVLAYQTGGLVLDHSNDIAAGIARCVADADSFYTLGYGMPAAKEVNEYHATQVKVDHVGVTVRTRTGYYAQPTGTH